MSGSTFLGSLVLTRKIPFSILRTLRLSLKMTCQCKNAKRHLGRFRGPAVLKRTPGVSKMLPPTLPVCLPTSTPLWGGGPSFKKGSTQRPGQASPPRTSGRLGQPPGHRGRAVHRRRNALQHYLPDQGLADLLDRQHAVDRP